MRIRKDANLVAPLIAVLALASCQTAGTPVDDGGGAERAGRKPSLWGAASEQASHLS